LTVFAQPVHNSLAALDTVAILRLAVCHLAFFDLFDDSQFKG
jgi:hypothetical protein